LFALGGLIFYTVPLPLLVLTSKSRAERIKKVRIFIKYSFKLFLNILEFFRLLTIETSGLENLANLRGCLVICNHPSLLDVLIILSHLKNMQCIVKNELWMNPFVGGIVRAADYIRNDMDPEKLLDCCKQQLAQGENIIIFPEGTRSTPGKPIKMLRGLGNLSLAAAADIQALTLNCYPAILVKGKKWYNIPAKPPVFQLQAGQLFINKNYQNSLPRSIRVRVLMRDIQAYYDHHLNIC
jgi:1-acyl-sn-glycerol-3-phosphate acyltransferase